MMKNAGGLLQHRTTGAMRRFLLILSAATLLVSMLATTVLAATTISQSYTITGDIALGSIVALKEESSDEIELATTENSGYIFGVAINETSSLLTIRGKQGKQIQVASGGTVDVLVSNVNGDIKQGDAITGSPIAGVGMKATDNIRIVGLAQADAGKGKEQTIKNQDGTEEKVNVTTIPVLVNVAYFFKEPEKTIIPSAIQNIANGIAGKKVDALPVLISGGIFLIMIVVVASLVYSMIRSSIISIGRNPLAQSSVYRNLLQLSAIVLVILTGGFVSIYMILTRL